MGIVQLHRTSAA